MKLGELLKAAREQKNVTLNEAEKATKIRTAYLDALEQENFHLLPGRIYTIGFLKSYAKFLGLSSQEVTEMYKSQYPEKVEEVPEKQAVNDINVNPEPPKKMYYLVGVLAIGILVIAGIWYQAFLPGNNEDSQTNFNSNNQVHANPYPDLDNELSEENDKADIKPENADGPPLKLRIEIVESDCWIEVTVDGKLELSKTLSPGTVVEFEGEQNIKVVYGNASAAKVIFNDMDYGYVGDRGQVVTKNYSLE